jgi:pyruvate dehydrogenase E2 component (dihydrolipoamide acetyltransferase)
MATEVILPRVDMDMTAGRIGRWYAEDGETVEKGQPLFEIETDKAAMEIEAPSAGILRKSSLPGTDAVPVGTTVGWICAPDEAAPAAGSVPGAGPETDVAPAAPAPAAPAEAPAQAAPEQAHGVAATPLARRLAAEYLIALADVPGSGPRRRIQARDVEQARATPAPVPARATAPVPEPGAVPEPGPVPEPEPGPAARSATRPAAPEAGLHRAWLRQGTGRPLVLLHGFGAELNSWRPLVAALGTERPILAVDLPGHGGSPALPAPSLPGLARAVTEALEAEGAGSVDLVGHSLGGAVAAEVAHGTEVRSLFLMAPAGLGPDINGAFLAGFNRASSEASLAPWLRLLVADERALAPGFVRATARLRLDAALVQAQAALAAALFPDGTQAFAIRAALERLDIPVRVVVGTEDRIIPAHHALDLPGSVAVHRLRGVGHMPFLEDRALLARILLHHLHDGGCRV